MSDHDRRIPINEHLAAIRGIPVPILINDDDPYGAAREAAFQDRGSVAGRLFTRTGDPVGQVFDTPRWGGLYVPLGVELDHKVTSAPKLYAKHPILFEHDACPDPDDAPTQARELIVEYRETGKPGKRVMT